MKTLLNLVVISSAKLNMLYAAILCNTFACNEEIELLPGSMGYDGLARCRKKYDSIIMIYWNSDLAQRLECTQEELSALPSYIDYIIQTVKTIWEHGMSASVEKIKKIEDPFLRFGLLLVSEGLAGDTLEEIFSVLLYVSEERGINFLKACVAAEAVLSVANSEPLNVMLRKLLPYCGIQQALNALSKGLEEHAD